MKKILLVLVVLIVFVSIPSLSQDKKVCDGIGGYNMGQSKKAIVGLLNKNDRYIEKITKNGVFAGGEIGGYLTNDARFQFGKNGLEFILLICPQIEEISKERVFYPEEEVQKYTTMLGDPVVSASEEGGKMYQWEAVTSKGYSIHVTLIVYDDIASFWFSTLPRDKK